MGPPPTTTKRNSASAASPNLSASTASNAAARSKFPTTRAWSLAASFDSFMKSACSLTPWIPKVAGAAPTAMTSLSYDTSTAASSVFASTVRPSTSTSRTSARRNVADAATAAARSTRSRSGSHALLSATVPTELPASSGV